jgi:hypothetical protein
MGASHHQLPSPNTLAFSATAHCLSGCAIGEVLGLVIGTALEWSNGATVVASILLAFVFGYGLTVVLLWRSGLPLRRVAALAFASATFSMARSSILSLCS